MLKLFVLLLCCLQAWTVPIVPENDDEDMHPPTRVVTDDMRMAGKEEDEAKFWKEKAIRTITEQLLPKKKIEKQAKNVILFMGDGMSVPTLTATRIFMGDENKNLSFDLFPYTAMAKTYCVDYQVPDSACTSTAYLTGVKGNKGTIGVSATVKLMDCKAMNNTENHVFSIAHYFQEKNRATGFVTTSRVTHASPAGVYAHTAARWWENHWNLKVAGKDPQTCPDIGIQLIRWEVGKKLNVIMGCGRVNLLPVGVKDDEGTEGNRSDGLNLIDEWKKMKEKEKAKYIWNRDQLLKLDDEDYVLGIFEDDHCRYNLDRDKKLDPSLEEMTVGAIKQLSKNPDGYFLFVEGARIDMAHHYVLARKALDETQQFSNAVGAAAEMTSEEDTLIVVISDHAHTMSIAGYPVRGNDILGLSGDKGDDGLPYTTLSYANGPASPKDEKRRDVSKDDFKLKNTTYAGIVPLRKETHGGDDIVVFARGPWAHLYAGVMEQNVIPHIMSFAACVGEGPTSCNTKTSTAGDHTNPSLIVLIILIAIHFFL